jgi:hypothetical protein
MDDLYQFIKQASGGLATTGTTLGTYIAAKKYNMADAVERFLGRKSVGMKGLAGRMLRSHKGKLAKTAPVAAAMGAGMLVHALTNRGKEHKIRIVQSTPMMGGGDLSKEVY